MPAQIIDGKAFAAALRGRVAAAAAALQSERGVRPGLATVLVGDDPASHLYVRNKNLQANEAGFHSVQHTLPGDTTQAALLSLIGELNGDASVHGILVQMPLPKQIDAQAAIAAIAPDKDVDGLHPLNAGRLVSGIAGEDRGLVACTPLGCMMLLRSVLPQLRRRRALVIGRSNLVGKPMGLLLLAADCTVTMAHSQTDALPELCRAQDIVVAAVGRPEMVRAGWLKLGAIVIDVGINRVDAGGGKTKLVGDVATAEAAAIASAITPTPGGVGPMTIACLLRNTVVAAAASCGAPAPAFA